MKLLQLLLERRRQCRERAIWRAGFERYRMAMDRYGKPMQPIDDRTLRDLAWRMAASEMWVVRFECGRPSKLRWERSSPPSYRYPWGYHRQQTREPSLQPETTHA